MTLRLKHICVSLSVYLAFVPIYSRALGANEPGTDAPRGILAPIGGGATQVEETGVVKRGQLQIFSGLYQLFQEQRGRYPGVGNKTCLISYSSMTRAELKIEFAPMVALLSAAGISEKEILQIAFSSRDRANDRLAVTQFKDNCGFVYLPGGNQTTELELWSDTAFQRALNAVYFAGGVISGKSAGAAVLGKWVFAPKDDRDAVVASFLGDAPVADFEMRDQPLLQLGSWFPEVLFETHAGDRERSARAAVLLGYLQERLKPSASQISRRADDRAQQPLVFAVDSDTAAVLQYVPNTGLWKLTVLGYRAVEIQSIDELTTFSSGRGGRIEVANLRSDLLGPQDVVWFDPKGELVGFGSSMQQLDGQARFGMGSHANSLKTCLASWAGQEIRGADIAAREERSSFWFKALVQPALALPRLVSEPVSFSETHLKSRVGSTDFLSIEEVEYAYLKGLVKEFQHPSASGQKVAAGDSALGAVNRQGCGLWLTRAFNADFGHPENRLNLLRYGLSKKLADVAFSVSEQTDIEILPDGGVAVTGDSDLSLFVIDARFARERTVSNIVYSELGASAPMQIGRYFEGRLHLIGPGGAISFADRQANVRLGWAGQIGKEEAVLQMPKAFSEANF